MSEHEQEWSALVKEILKTPAFKRAPLRSELLRYLYGRIHRVQGISRKLLAAEVFKSPHYDEGAVGERCLDLRNALIEYAESGPGLVRKWRCELPPAIPAEGYKLRFINQVAAPGMTGTFWQAHLTQARNIIVVYNEPLFYRDMEAMAATRYIDINYDQTQTSQEAIMLELKNKKPAAYKDCVYPSFLYLMSGEIAARDYLAEWFASVAGVRIQGRITRHTTSSEIAQSSPVLLGNFRTNYFIRSVLDSPHCQQLDYGLHAARFGTIVIRNATPDEATASEKYPHRVFENNDLVLNTIWGVNHDVFGIVTRIPNPYEDEGVITIISSDYTRAIEQIAHALTNEHRFAALGTQAGWSVDSPLRSCFQCIFAVRLGPVNMDTEARPPVLLATREY